MFYAHVYEFLNRKKINNLTWRFLLAPFFLVSTIHLIYFGYSTIYNEASSLPDYNEPGLLLYTNIISFGFIFVVVNYTYKLILKSENTIKGNLLKLKRKVQWYKRIIKLAAITTLIGTFSVALILALELNPSYTLYPFYIIETSIVYWIAYVGLEKATIKFPKREISITMMGSTYSKINRLVVSEKLYLSQDLTLGSISQRFGISSGYLSQLINKHNNYGFTDYINKLRVEDSKAMLISQKFKRYTIESIGLECGFNSKSTYFVAFKKHTGQTPNQYRKNSVCSDDFGFPI